MFFFVIFCKGLSMLLAVILKILFVNVKGEVKKNLGEK